MRRDIAQKIWTYTVAIIMIGLAALYSASHENVRVPHSIFYDQLLCTAVGLVFMYLLGKVDYRKFYDVAYVLFLLNIVLLVCVLASGKYILGARRWMMIGGISFQPSELTKLSLILVLGRYLSNRRPTLSFGFFSRSQILLKDLIVPFLITAVPMVMIFKQPDLGTAILLFGIFIVMVFVTNLEYRYIFGFLGLCLAALPFAWSILKPYQKDRLLVFLNPNIDPLGAGYTIIQSRIAVGSGQILGTLLLVCLYFLLIINSLQIANQVKDKFGMLVTVGIVGILTLQVVINVGMVLGLFPIVGLTLPFVSYGRTSFMVFILMMGFLLNLSKRRTIF